MEFIDAGTKRFCAFDEIISSYKPVSVWGKRAFAMLSPLKGDGLSAHFEFLLKVKACGFDRTRVENILADFHEILGSISSIENGTACDVDLFEIKRFVHHHKILKHLTTGLNGFFIDLDELWELLDPKNSGSFSFSPENDLIEGLLKKYEILKRKIDELYQERMKLISEEFALNLQDKRFVIEREMAMEIIKSNLVMIEREGIKTYTLMVRPTEEILRQENELGELEDEISKAEDEEVRHLSCEIKKWTTFLKAEINKICEFDISFAQIRALDDGYAFPRFDDEINLKAAFHPAISNIVKNSSDEYTTLDGKFSEGLTMIFGPNMGGKTTVLRTIAISCALAMYGFLVPAKSAMLPVIDWVRFIGSSSQNTDLSGFATQIDDISKVLQMNERGLILIDEFGSGTNPYEGEALATALARYLSKSTQFSVMVTHFKHTIESVKCVKYTIGRINFDETITMANLNSKIDHHLVNGATINYGDAIKLARILGLPEAITRDASVLIDHL